MTNATVAAGMIVERKIAEDAMKRRTDRHDAGTNVRLQDKRKVSAEQRSGRLNQKPFVMWITGLPRSGKSTIAYAGEELRAATEGALSVSLPSNSVICVLPVMPGS